jgi:hypothetical protein
LAKRGARGPRTTRKRRLWGAMLRLRMADLLATAPVDPDAHHDPARVERYAGIFDALPPAVVFETPEGLPLVDGYDSRRPRGGSEARDGRGGGEPRIATRRAALCGAGRRRAWTSLKLTASHTSAVAYAIVEALHLRFAPRLTA